MTITLDALALSSPLPKGLEAELRAAYASPPRAYHSFEHVLEVLGHFLRVPTWSDRDAVALAILFHDAVYVAGRADNEDESAKLAVRLLEGTAFEACSTRVAQLVRLTARHGSIARDDVDQDTALFLDCDMAILGAAPEAFDRYERAIGQEYAAVPREAYRAGRARFLDKLLASPRIYLSSFFYKEREAQARANLERARARLA
jgi:predicted metal-dependent HD superfamily phosphohydrolase